MDKENVCSICLNDFTQPKSLICSHIFCYQCLRSYANKSLTEDGQFPCPLCRHFIQLPSGGVENLPAPSNGNSCGVKTYAGVTSTAVSKPIIKPVDSTVPKKRKLQICDLCENKTVLKFHCKNCKQRLCNDCKKGHDQYFLKKNHDVVTISENDPEGDTDGDDWKSCSDHPDELLIIHCTDCVVLVCLQCYTEKHNGHKILNLRNSETQAQFRQNLHQLNLDLKRQISRSGKFSQELASKFKGLENSTEQQCKEIDKQVQLLSKMINTRGEQLKAMIRHVQNERGKKLRTLMEELDDGINRLTADIDNASGSLKRKPIHEIIEMIENNQIDETEIRLKDMMVPDLEVSKFKSGNVLKEQLFQQLGSCENVKDVDFVYNVKKILNNSYSIQERFFDFYGVKWKVIAVKDDTYLGLYLSSCQTDIDVRNYQEEITFTLISKLHGKSFTKKSRTVQVTPGGAGRGYPEFVTWSYLIDPSNGFCDKDGNISIKLHIKATEFFICK